MQGEMAQQAQMMPQQNPENVGIMQGFEDDAETIAAAGAQKLKRLKLRQITLSLWIL